MPNFTPPKLKDKDFLYEKYILEKLSTVKIASIVGCSAITVNRALLRVGIPVRTVKEVNSTRGKRGSKYIELNDYQWLYNKYHEEKLTSYQIAEILGTSNIVVIRSMQRLCIKSRSMSEAAKLKYVNNPAEKGKKHKELFPLLLDKQWLEEKYITEKMSSTKIGEILGCRPGAVSLFLEIHGIKVRTNSESHKKEKWTSKKYDKLNDQQWLLEEYLTNKNSLMQIANQVGAKNHNSVRQVLVHMGVETRNLREAQILGREEDGLVVNKDIIDGGLLGDASVFMFNRHSDICMPFYSRKNKYYDHVLWVAKHMVSEPEKAIVPVTHKLNGKSFVYSYFRTLSNDLLLPYFRRWYPKENNYKKLIPEDVSIHPASLLHCFLDDGTSERRKRNGKLTNQIKIKLCLQGFKRDNLEMFCDKVNKKYNLGMRTHYCGTGFGYLVGIPQAQAGHFYEIIGPPPVKSLAYKWKSDMIEMKP